MVHGKANPVGDVAAGLAKPLLADVPGPNLALR